ncbi:MAG: PDZ domain-containing protein [Micrococcales bacterium]|nr:PDZ domain-containing protein [Micrococcales bacterium]
MRRWLNTPRKRVVALALACWLALLGLMEVVSVPYVRMAPGPMFDVLAETDGTAVIAIDGARTYPTGGRLDMTTVSERGGPFGHLTLFEAFTGWLDPSVAVVPTDILYPPDASRDAVKQAGADQFDDSQQRARIAALREVGEPVTTRPWVMDVLPGSPAEGVLEHGDVVLRVDGQSVAGPRQMARVVQQAGPGATVELDVRRDGSDRRVDVVAIANPEDPGKGYLGLSLGVLADSPVTVDFHLDDVGGPSAGLVFALGIVDKLTPGQLLDGRFVAGTGTMDDTGKVGPIGGIAQKMAAASSQGAAIFLAPAGNCDEVLSSAPEGLTVVPVRTLAQARGVLDGTIPAPRCPTS